MVQKNYNTLVLLLFFFLGFCNPLSAQTFPLISELYSRNAVFMQYMQEVEESYKALARGDSTILVNVYTYTAQKNDTLIKIAARCTVPYETIALLNRISAIDVDITGKKLLLPTVPGLFIPLDPQTSFDTLILTRDFDFKSLPCYTLNTEVFYFIANGKLTPTERAFFLDTGLRLPLPQGIMTSAYGMRTSPITGSARFHEGIDLAAPFGTPVLSCRSGTVLQTGFDRVYGNYIIVRHDNGYESLYAHLETVLTAREKAVARGERIGLVGSTGASTGPHLHFEIRIDGKSKNPGFLLKGNR